MCKKFLNEVFGKYGKVEKGYLRALVLVVVFSMLVSTVYAQTTFESESACADYLEVINVHKDENSHVSTTAYDKRICYQPSRVAGTAQTLVYRDVASKNSCFGNNIVFEVTGPTNAHLALPWSNSYAGNDICYGYLQCYPGSIGHPYEVPFVKLSGSRNAHVTPTTSTDGAFGTRISCVEPICDQAFFDSKQPFPLLYSFNQIDEPLEFRENSHYSVIAPSIVTPESPHYDRALKVSSTGGEANQLKDIRISDWSGFYGLEFFVMPRSISATSATMNVVITSGSGAEAQSHSYAIDRYALEKVQQGTWAKVRLPLWDSNDNSYINLTDVRQISFNPTAGGNFYIDTIGFVSSTESELNFWQTYYCTRDPNDITTGYQWVNDADDELNACENTFGMDQTGTRCCGDDFNEFFVDSQAGCFDSVKVGDGQAFGLLSNDGLGQVCFGEECDGNTDNSTLLKFAYSQDGKFQSCGVNTNYVRTQGEGSATGQLLFDAVDYSLRTPRDGEVCAISGDYFCDPEGFWSTRTDNVEYMDILISNESEDSYDVGLIPITSGANRTHIKQDFDNSAEVAYSCCPESYCWHGGTCYENMANEPKNPGVILDDGSSYRCVDGNWFSGVTKRSPDGAQAGYCPTQNHCLVSPDGTQGDPNNPQCLASGETFNELYCNAGEWTSRTAITAKTLIEFAKTDRAATKYTAYCDSYENTLNFLGERNGQNVDTLLFGTVLATSTTPTTDICGTDGCTNNFCVLKSIDPEEVMFGTSVNTEITNSRGGLGAVFNISCAEGQTGLQSCVYTGVDNVDGTWFYDADNKIVIFVRADSSILGQLSSRLSVWLSRIWHVLTPADEQELPDLFSLSTRFNRAYVSEGLNVNVNSYSEEVFDLSTNRYKNTFAVKYTGHDNASFICDLVENFQAQADKEDYNTDFTCEVDGDDALVYTTDSNLNSIWPSLTAYLRQETE